jgi:hypothetical protein
MNYQHPGRAFLEIHSAVQTPEDVSAYAQYLRRQAGLGDADPADLEKIRAAFGIPLPKRARLPNQQGLLLLPDLGVILINEGDIPARQRFTEAHELIELLFDALPNGTGWAARQRGPFRHHTKERLCDEGAARLLMPAAVFARAAAQAVSFNTAGKLARRFGVSTTAALVQLVRHSPGRHSLAAWRLKHKPTDQQPAAAQLSLFGGIPAAPPAPKLRVDWVMSAPASPHIPLHKSIPEESEIHRAFREGRFTQGEERLDLGSAHGRFRSENWGYENSGERRVLSLLEFLGR